MTDPANELDVFKLTPRLIADVLPAWNLHNAQVRLISISENLTYRVDSQSSNEVFVLRIHRPGYHTLEELIAEQHWTDALRQCGIEVPIHVKTSDGRGFVELAMPAWDTPRHVGLARWMKGRLLIDHDGADSGVGLVERYRQLGAIMAAMHNQATGWSPPAGFSRHSFDADGLMGETPFWGRFWEHPGLSHDQRRLLNRIRGVLHHRLSQFSKTGGGYSMIHADMHQGNLLIDGDRLRVIDFDDAGFGFHLYDVAVALFHLRHRDDFAELRDSIISGYSPVRWPRFLQQDLSMFLLVRSLASLGWIADRPEIDQSRVPGMIKSCVEMSNEFLSARSQD